MINVTLQQPLSLKEIIKFERLYWQVKVPGMHVDWGLNFDCYVSQLFRNIKKYKTCTSARICMNMQQKKQRALVIAFWMSLLSYFPWTRIFHRRNMQHWINPHSFPMHPFSNPRKYQKTVRFLMFSGGRKRLHWKLMG